VIYHPKMNWSISLCFFLAVQLFLAQSTPIEPSSVKASDVGIKSEVAARRLGIYEIQTSGFPSYGDPSGSDGFPSYYERAHLTWINTVRMDPAYFKSTWMASRTDSSLSSILNPSNLPANSGVRWNLNLDRSSRAHSVDRETCAADAGGSPHYDCNVTNFDVRIPKFYTAGGEYGEIFWDYSSWGLTQYIWPFYAVAGWICDGPMYSNGNMIDCGADGEDTAGHRQAIMAEGAEFGCGYSWDASTSRAISTCDWGGPAYYTNSIVSGAHLFDPGAEGGSAITTFRFVANYSPLSGSFKSANVIVDGETVSMSLQSGSANQGTYQSAEYTSGTKCRTYYFEFVTDTTTERYPTTGTFYTFAEGSCDIDWSDGTVTDYASGTESGSYSQTPITGLLISLIGIVVLLAF